jgi:hypothetical protein
MSKRNKDKGRLPPFVPLFREILASAAWKATLSSSRVVYIALHARYSGNLRNNGKIYLSVRMAMKETGLSYQTIRRAFHELEHYGFIIKTTAGSLGVDGLGKAPRWRLTTIGYMTDPPTRDFLHWDGVLYDHSKNRIPKQKLPHPEAKIASLLKQNLPH